MWLAVCAAGDCVVVDVGSGVAEHAFDGDDGFFRGDVSEPRWADDVADCVDPRKSGFISRSRCTIVGSGFDVASVDFDAK